MKWIPCGSAALLFQPKNDDETGKFYYISKHFEIYSLLGKSHAMSYAFLKEKKGDQSNKISSFVLFCGHYFVAPGSGSISLNAFLGEKRGLKYRHWFSFVAISPTLLDPDPYKRIWNAALRLARSAMRAASSSCSCRSSPSSCAAQLDSSVSPFRRFRYSWYSWHREKQHPANQSILTFKVHDRHSLTVCKKY
jgi:hypothetical protein